MRFHGDNEEYAPESLMREYPYGSSMSGDAYHPHWIYPSQSTVGFGGSFSPTQLASTGIISFAITKLLGASVPGAIAMGIGNVLWEAGSPGIPAGWKRYVLGLFRKPAE